MKFFIWANGTVSTSEISCMSDDYFTINTDQLSWSEVKEIIYRHFNHHQGFWVLEEIQEYLDLE